VLGESRTLNRKAYNREYRARNRERLSQYRRAYAKAHPNKVKCWRHNYYIRHRDEIREQTRLIDWPARRQKIKRDVLEHYSNSRPVACVRCGIEDIRVLSVDHVDGNGAAHRKKLKTRGGTAFYAWLRRHNYPPGFQVLCMNHQWIKRVENHECNHQAPRNAPSATSSERRTRRRA
jgi:hypothetical protein